MLYATCEAPVNTSRKMAAVSQTPKEGACETQRPPTPIQITLRPDPVFLQTRTRTRLTTVGVKRKNATRNCKT
ncbi:hypothetical protein BC826DRAFT_1085656 [Russula brevipes]|nr:hypothetical protein BC826DRAFT_1085656 [Russula brevipes]